MKKIKESFGESIWQWKAVEYLVYSAVFIIPLFVGKSHWFPFSAPKTLLIHATAGVMLLLFGWGLLVQKQKQESWEIGPIHIALGIFLVVVTLGAIIGIDPRNSFFGVWSQSISIVLLYSVSTIACLVGFLVRHNQSVIPKLFTTSFTSSVVFALISYFGETVVPASRVGSTLGNSSFAGAYLLLNICFGIGLLFWYKRYWQKLLAGLGILVTGFTPIFFNHGLFAGTVTWTKAFKNLSLFMGQANAAIVGVMVSLTIILGLWLTYHQKKWISRAGVVFVVIVLSTVFVTGIVLSNPKSSLHQSIVEQKSANRFLFWDIANSGFVENPVLGNGFNNYIYTYQAHFKKDFYESKNSLEPWTNQPHNMYWEYMSTVGILGTVSFLALLIIVFLLLYARNASDNQVDDKYHILKIVMAGGLVGYFVQNLFGFDVSATYLLLFITIGISIGVAPSFRSITIQNRYYLKRIFGIKVVVLGMLMIIFLGILPWQESRQWRLVTNKSNIVNNFQVLETLQRRSIFGGVADSAFLIDSFFTKYQKEVIVHIQKTKSAEILENIENFLEQELVRQPNNFRARLVLARIMIMHMFLDAGSIDGLWNRAQVHLEKSHQLNTQSPDYFFEMGHLYMIKNNISQARAYMRAGIAIAPEYVPGYALARGVNQRYPDASFMNYINTMETKWVSQK